MNSKTTNKARADWERDLIAFIKAPKAPPAKGARVMRGKRRAKRCTMNAAAAPAG